MRCDFVEKKVGKEVVYMKKMKELNESNLILFNLFLFQTRNRHVFELLMEFKEKLEEKFECLHLQNLDTSL